jgi:hypothetical protein
MEHPQIFLPEGQEPPSARWHAENGAPAPKRVVIADDTMTADTAYRLASEGVGLLWRSDFQNARQLLQALCRQAAQAQTQTGGTGRYARRRVSPSSTDPGAARAYAGHAADPV